MAGAAPRGGPCVGTFPGRPGPPPRRSPVLPVLPWCPEHSSRCCQGVLELPLPLSSIVFQASPCLQPRPCQVCAVLVVPGELFPSLLLVWPRWGCAEPGGALWLPQPSSCLHGHATRAGQCGSANPSSFQVVLTGEGGEGALFGCRAGILRAGIMFYKNKVSTPRPWRWGWMSWLFVTVLKTLSD